jgi:hypothetical protein
MAYIQLEKRKRRSLFSMVRFDTLQPSAINSIVLYQSDRQATNSATVAVGASSPNSESTQELADNDLLGDESDIGVRFNFSFQGNMALNPIGARNCLPSSQDMYCVFPVDKYRTPSEERYSSGFVKAWNGMEMFLPYSKRQDVV